MTSEYTALPVDARNYSRHYGVLSLAGLCATLHCDTLVCQCVFSGAISSTLCSDKKYRKLLEPFLAQTVAPEFESPLPFMRARCAVSSALHYVCARASVLVWLCLPRSSCVWFCVQGCAHVQRLCGVQGEVDQPRHPEGWRAGHCQGVCACVSECLCCPIPWHFFAVSAWTMHLFPFGLLPASDSAGSSRTPL